MRFSPLFALIFLASAPSAAHAQFFDSFDPPGVSLPRPADSSPGSLITVSDNVVITNIAVHNSLTSAGNIRFLIFDHATHELLFASAPQAVSADAAANWKKSLPFYFLLRAGQQYDVGAISDVAGEWSTDTTSNTEGGISSDGTNNPNFSKFGTPTLTGHTTSDGAVRLYALEHALLFDTFDSPGSSSSRPGNSSPGSLIEVDQDVILTNIAVRNDLSSGGGNLRFLVFDHASHTLLYASDPQPYPSDFSLNWKKSPPIVLQLRAGRSYDVGAIADVGALWSSDIVAGAELGILGSALTNPNFASLPSPFVASHATGDAAVRVYGAPAPELFDSFDGSSSASTRVAGESPGGQIFATQNTVITNIGVRNKLDSAGNLRFLIWSHPAHKLLFASDPEPFAADGSPTWKKSEPFAFQLLAGESYDIGAIADVSGEWSFDLTLASQAGIVSAGISNANFSNFADPISLAHGGADSAVRLYTAGYPIVNTFDPPGFVVMRPAGNSPGSLFTVSQDTIITNIAVHNLLSGAGNLRFLIFDHTTHTVVRLTGSESFNADAGAAWKTSSLPIATKLLARHRYDIGAISDVAADWSADLTSNSGGGVTSDGSGNPNFSNFANPAFVSHGLGDAAVRLLPEPGGPLALALAIAWLASLDAVRRARRASRGRSRR